MRILLLIIFLHATWYNTKGVMANGKEFKAQAYTCATRLYPLGACLRVTNISNGKGVDVIVTDRINKRYGNTRIDLTPMAFSRIGKLEEGNIPVKVELIKEER